MIEKTGGAAVLAFEVAGEVGELLVAEFQGDELDGFSGGETMVGDIEAIIPQPLPEGAAVGLAEMALDGPGGDAADEGDFAGLELRAMGEGLPIERLVGASGNGETEYRQMIGLNHMATVGFSSEHFTSSTDNKNKKSGLTFQLTQKLARHATRKPAFGVIPGRSALHDARRSIFDLDVIRVITQTELRGSTKGGYPGIRLRNGLRRSEKRFFRER